MTQRIVTTVEAKGRAIAKFELAEFCVEVTEHAQTAPATRSAILAASARVLKSVDHLRARGMQVEPGSLRVPRSDLRKRERYVDHETKMDGYVATYELRWKTPSLDMVNDIYNQLLFIEAEELNVKTPEFSLRDSEALKSGALEKAWENVKARLAHQRKVIVDDHQDVPLDVVSWEVGYEGWVRASVGVTGPTGSTGATGPQGITGVAERAEELLEIHPGHAIITVALVVRFGAP